MTKTAKARPGVAAPGQAVETGTPCKMATTSTTDDTISAAGRQFQIADLLHPGAENAVSRRDLMSLTGMSDRKLRLQIEAERRHGCPILSDNQHGYWIAADQAEVQHFTWSMRSRAREILRTARAVEQSVW